MSLRKKRKAAKKPKNTWYTEPPVGNPGARPSNVIQMNTLRRIPSDFLIAQPSFVSGVARLIDFSCSFDSYNKSASPAEADFRASLSDWISVGFDILDVTENVERGKKIA